MGSAGDEGSERTVLRVLLLLVVVAVVVIVALRALGTARLAGDAVADLRRRAHDAGRRFRAVIDACPRGPLRRRLEELVPDVDAAVAEADRLARLAWASRDAAPGVLRRLDDLDGALDAAVGAAADLAASAGGRPEAEVTAQLEALRMGLAEARAAGRPLASPDPDRGPDPHGDEPGGPSL